MRLNSKNASLLILAITAFACSRVMLTLFDDPEGPNLLVVTVMAAIIYLPPAAAYLSKLCPSLTEVKRTVATILIQVLVAAGFYLGLR